MVTNPPLAEVRVHGIGDKQKLSALGEPEEISRVSGGRATVDVPPPIPKHELRLVNWSRWNRTGWSLGWILSWPFTLLNAAAEMHPESKRASRTHLFVVRVFSLMLTALSVVWISATLEGVSRILWLPGVSHVGSGYVAVIMAATCLLIIISYRGRTANPAHEHPYIRDEKPYVPSRPTLGIHAGTIIVTAATILAVRPSQILVAIDNPLFRGIVAQSYTSEDYARIRDIYQQSGIIDPVRLTEYLDPLAVVSYGSIAIAAVVLFFSAFLAESRVSTQCAMVSITISVAVLNLYGSVLVAASQTVARSLDGTAARRFQVSNPRLDEAMLIGRTGPGYSTLVLPLALSAILLIVLIAVVRGGLRIPFGEMVRRESRRLNLSTRVHRNLPHLGKRLPISLLFAAAMAGLIIEFIGLGVGTAANRWGRYQVVDGVEIYLPGTLAKALLTLSAVLLGGLVFALRSSALRARLSRTLAFVGDVIGFWPAKTQPFAAQSYRPAALEATGKALAGLQNYSVVLVGHSQGSVLAAWYLSHEVRATSDVSRVALVTCGSPLASLYSRFFPAHFGVEFYGRLGSPRSYWVNLWRNTDPIASSIPEADQNWPLPDPRPGEEARCHSHYWTDEDAIEYVGSIFETARNSSLREPDEQQGEA